MKENEQESRSFLEWEIVMTNSKWQMPLVVFHRGHSTTIVRSAKGWVFLCSFCTLTAPDEIADRYGKLYSLLTNGN